MRVAEGGEGAVGIFQDWRAQFIWMHLRMPGVDGAEATRRIRTMERGHEVKIVAVTASENISVPPHGMDGLVHKPFRTNEIFDCMAHQLGVRYRDATPWPFAESPAILRPEALAALPDDLRAELTSAVMRLDLNQINSVIGRASELDAELGEALAFPAGRFALTEVLEALRECKSVTM